MLPSVTKTPATITRRLRYVETEVAQQERTFLSNVLASALPGLERLLGDERHDILKRKMRYNSIGITFNGGRDDKVRNDICIRMLIPFFELKGMTRSLLSFIMLFTGSRFLPRYTGSFVGVCKQKRMQREAVPVVLLALPVSARYRPESTIFAHHRSASARMDI